MTPEPYLLNISEMQDFERCRFRWWAKWVMNYVPKHEAQPLGFGKLIHRVFETYHNGVNPMVDSIQSQRQSWLDQMAVTTDQVDIAVGTKVLKQLDDLTEALVQWGDIYTFEEPCLEVEVPFEIDLGDGIVGRGRPDRVAVRDGLLWHVQHKALAAGTHFGVFTDLAKRSYHEHLYAEALIAKYIGQYKGYGGTMFDLIRKLKYRTKITKANPLGECKRYEEMFQQVPVAIDLDGPVHQHVMSCIKQHGQQMRQCRLDWQAHGTIPAPSENMNGGAFGNSPDEYFRVLTGEYELGDPRYFKQREDTYETPEGSEQE
jgi:hypothetical protein